MSTEPMFYDIHQMLPTGETLRLGVFAIQTSDQGRIEHMQFRYEESFLAHPKAQPISPLMPTLTKDTYAFKSDGHSFVGFVDDLLPDDWGKRIIARRLGKRFITDLDALDFIGHGVSIGATKITPVSRDVNWSLGIPIEEAESAINAIHTGDLDSLSPEQLEAGLLVQGGSHVGGARPKMLVLDRSGKPCVIKPNQDMDRFDYAVLEWSALEVCRSAGLSTAEASLEELPNKIRSLMIQRFDVLPNGGRRHLISINSLLKDSNSQIDAMNYSYEDIAKCIKKYSWRPKEDLKQLFGQMLINQALSNTDDHLRNFSMQQCSQGWELTPVYDVHPHHFFRGEHACFFNGSGFLPTLKKASKSGKRLDLAKGDIEDVVAHVEQALAAWPRLLKEKGITEKTILSLVETTQST